MQQSLQKELEKIYVIQPITRENEQRYDTLHDEAISLIESAGAAYAGTIYQNVKEVNAATFIGMGKLQELNERLYGLDNITILFNGELTPSQTLNISSALGDRKVIDRTTLILDIFAKNAKSSEGKIQVELAQLKYIYPRLRGKGAALSRLGGGVGTRGPGETQLETDRRYIRGRLKYLQSRLKELEQRREQQTQRRKKDQTKTIALVGYTNTGKSSLMNTLTNAQTYVKNELFATLDPTARQWNLHGIPFLLVDTVGFLQDLPHNLIQAFHSTLESALHCDLALIVCDAMGAYDMQLQTTINTLQELGFHSPYLMVMNKSEEILDTQLFPTDSIMISAKTGKGINDLQKAILSHFQKEFLFCELFVPYTEIDRLHALRAYFTQTSVEYTDDGQLIQATIPIQYAQFFADFIKNRNTLSF